ncbi:kinase-like domain-containing protein [Earliella scabrosa]|nr:kinase-like domain-containing protein [Earliella scabrosa]
MPATGFLCGGNVGRLTSRLVLKQVPLNRSRVEAEAIRFVCQHTSLPIPRLRMYWEEGTIGSLIIDYAEGETLQRAWKRLSDEQRSSVMRKVAGFVQELRSIPQPPPPPGSSLPRSGWIGSPLGNPFHDCRMTSSEDPYGPFPSEREFNDWKVSRFAPFGERSVTAAAHIAQLRRAMSDQHPIVFTHGDINRRNILVRIHGDGPDDVEITAFIDWEQAGWRPIHWESVKWCFMGGMATDWTNFAVDEIGAGYGADIALEEELQDISGHIPY